MWVTEFELFDSLKVISGRFEDIKWQGLCMSSRQELLKSNNTAIAIIKINVLPQKWV